MRKNIIDENEDVFSAKRSGKISTKMEADNDTWVENLTVVEILAPNRASDKRRNADIDVLNLTEDGYRFQIRSFFESYLSGSRVWDEPPSGASNIKYASVEARQMAETQIKDLRVTTEAVSDIHDDNGNEICQNVMQQLSKSTMLKNRFAKVLGKKKQDRKLSPTNEKRRIGYKPGSQSSQGRRKWNDDLQLQIALERSMTCRMDSHAPSLDTLMREKEEIEISKALSLSETALRDVDLDSKILSGEVKRQ